MPAIDVIEAVQPCVPQAQVTCIGRCAFPKTSKLMDGCMSVHHHSSIVCTLVQVGCAQSPPRPSRDLLVASTSRCISSGACGPPTIPMIGKKMENVEKMPCSEAACKFLRWTWLIMFLTKRSGPRRPRRQDCASWMCMQKGCRVLRYRLRCTAASWFSIDFGHFDEAEPESKNVTHYHHREQNFVHGPG